MILARATASERKTLRKVLQLEEPKKRKFNNRITYVDNIRFDSQKEARRYVELKLLAESGYIQNLELQPKYELRAYPHCVEDGPVKIGSYLADFRYRRNGLLVVEDVKSKGTITAVYRLKKKMMLANYGIKIQETL